MSRPTRRNFARPSTEQRGKVIFAPPLTLETERLLRDHDDKTPSPMDRPCVEPSKRGARP